MRTEWEHPDEQQTNERKNPYVNIYREREKTICEHMYRREQIQKTYVNIWKRENRKKPSMTCREKKKRMI
jgi:hypothetical protein